MAEENLQVEKTSEQIFDFVEQLRALQTSDKGHPDTFNPLFQNLIQNDLYLRQKVELLKGLIDELERDIADTINIDLTTLKQHLDDRSNPHNVTADQLGLGSISNYSIATTPEAQQGVVNTKYMTPLRTKEAIQYMTPSKADFTGHIENRNNPHGVTVGQIGAIPTSHSSYRNWIWSGQPGQPQWMWGGDTPSDIYVYNPSNFNVRRSVFTDFLSTQNTGGGSHGEGLPLCCRHNVFGDGRFGVKVDGHETRVDYATSANNVGGYDINQIKEMIKKMGGIGVTPSNNFRGNMPFLVGNIATYTQPICIGVLEGHNFDGVIKVTVNIASVGDTVSIMVLPTVSALEAAHIKEYGTNSSQISEISCVPLGGKCGGSWSGMLGVMSAGSSGMNGTFLVRVSRGSNIKIFAYSMRSSSMALSSIQMFYDEL